MSGFIASQLPGNLSPERQAFLPMFTALISNEGAFTNKREDRGNWTSGVVGKGILKGTKYGVSAMSYPDLDIERLTYAQAFAIYFRDFYQRCACDELPAAIRFMVFDSAVNNGPGNAARFLQRAIGVADDGDIGPRTRAAIAKADPLALMESFSRERTTFHTKLSTWGDFGKGWAIRLATVVVQSLRFGGVALSAR
jgi:lysozyme family protein